MVCLSVLGLLAFSLPQPALGATWRSRYECTLVENRYNDGDSFHVKWHGREYIYRLYYVDTPESDSSLSKRVIEQAEYWGIDPSRVPALAKEATAFTQAFLKDEFTIYTQYDTARGRSKLKRYYGMIKVDDQYLSEALVRAGYARVYGNYVDLLPDGLSDDRYLARLRSAERKAKREGLGGWASGNPKKGLVKAAKITGSVALNRSVTLYSLDKPPRALGVLRSGTVVEVLGPRGASMLHVTYEHESSSIEGQCMRSAMVGARPQP